MDQSVIASLGSALDELVRLREELQTYKTYAASATHAGAVGLWRLSFEGELAKLYLSQEAFEVLGLEREEDHESLNLSFLDRIDPSGKDDLFKMKDEMLSGKRVEFVCPYHHSKKGLVIIKFSGEADKYLSKDSLEFSGYCQDVTTSDDSLNKIKNEFDSMYQAISNTGITSCMYRPGEGTLFFTEQAVKMYNLKSKYDDMPRSFVSDYVHEIDQLTVIDCFKHIDDGEATSEARFSNRDRSVTFKLSMSVVLRDEENRPIEVFGLLENITQLEKSQNEAMSIRRAHRSLMEQAEEISEINRIQRQMTESFPLGILAYTLPDRRIIICNLETFRLLNHPVDESLAFDGSELMNNVNTDDLPKISVAARNLKNVGDTVEYSFRTTLENGSVAYIKCTSKICELDNGSRYIVSGLRDMTDLVQTNLLLSSERAAFRDALINNSLCTFVSDITDGLMLEELKLNDNDSIIEGYGDVLPMDHDLAVKTFIKNNKGQFLTRKDKEASSRAHILTTYDAGISADYIEMYLGKTDRYIKMMLLLSENPLNGHVMCYCFCNDITDEKKVAIEKLKIVDERVALQSSLLEEERRSNRQYSVLSVLSSEFYFIGYIDLIGQRFTTVRVLDSVARFFGISLDNEMPYLDVYNAFIENVVLPEDYDEMAKYRSMSYLRECAANGMHNHLFRMKINGEEVYCQLRFAFAKTDNEENTRYIVMGFSDVDKSTREKISHQQELKDALAKAELANVAKTSFLNNMSHDIRTPMNAIIGFTTLAISHIDEKEKTREYLGKIQSSSGHLLSLINDVLDMSRIESGKLHIEEKENSISGILTGIESIISDDAAAKNLNVTFDISEVKHDAIWCDKLRLSQVLLNCLSNSIKFTPAGGSISVSVKEHPEKKFLMSEYEFRVKDTGIGMSEEFIAKIFEPFERARTSTVSGIQGTGLGMSICKSIVDMMNGTIRVESEEGVGSEFIIVITFQRVMDIEVPAKNRHKKASSTAERKITSVENLKVLLVEDNFLNMEIATQILEESKVIVEKAYNGKEALDIIEASSPDKFDIILMDIQMPIMDGYEAARAIRDLDDATKSNIPIIAMTANAFDEDRKAAFDAGMNAHIAKPIDVNMMLNTIMEVMDKGNTL